MEKNTIKVKLNTNSPIPVDIKQKSGTVSVKPDSTYDYKILHGEIVAETERATGVEENLQEQINQLEHSVKYIPLVGTSGTLNEETILELTSNRLNQIILDNGYQRNNYYKLAYKDNDTWRLATDVLYRGDVQYINVNIHTGEWEWTNPENEARKRLEQKLDEHIADNNRHLRTGERERWNDKVTCDYIPDTETVQDGTLLLTKDNIHIN